MIRDHEDYRFGSACWTALDDLRRAGLFQPSGPMLGCVQGIPLHARSDGPIFTCGGAGSGKGRDVLVANTCGYRGWNGRWHAPRRMLVNDPRGEHAAISVGNLVRLGKLGYFINPFGLHGMPRHRVNPWNIIRKVAPTFHADVKLLVADLMPLSTGNEPYFSIRAREWTEAIVKALVWSKPVSNTRDAITLPELYDAINAIAQGAAWDALAETMLNTPFIDVQRVAAEMDEKREGAEKEFGAIMGSIYQNIGFLSDPAIRECLSGSDFSLEILCQQDCNIYLMIPAEYMGLLGPMQRAIFGAAMLYKNRHPEAPQVLLMIDEAAQLGNFESLLRAFSYGRGLGIRAWAVFQDPDQIARNFGQSAAAGIIGSSQYRQFFGVRDHRTAQLVSNMLGNETLEYDSPLEQTLAERNRLHSVYAMLGGVDPWQAGVDYALNARAAIHRTKQLRALMTPDEVMTMPEGAQILFASGFDLGPILAEKIPYFMRPDMAGAYLPNPYHPPLDCVKVRTRWRSKEARVITDRVPTELAQLPQYQGGEWSYIEGYKPKL